MKRILPFIVATLLCTQLMACYGSYSAFHAVHRWNGTVSGSKVVNSAVHFAMWVIPVYPLLLMGDFFIFNTVEFATDKRVFN